MKDNHHDQNRTPRERYLDLQAHHAENAPLCACGCGQKVLWDLHSKSYRTYRFNHHYKRVDDVVLTPRQKQIIRGTLLGDGSLQYIRNRRSGEAIAARLRIRHSTRRQLEYARWLRQELDGICSVPLRIRPNGGYGDETAVFCTLSHPELFAIGQEVCTPRKTITRAYLNTLEPLGLAVWWMDDGSTAAFSTHRYSIAENRIILKWLEQRWGIIGEVRMDRRVQLPFLTFQPNVYQLLQVVFPHVLRSLWYKFGRFLPRLLSEARS